MASDMIQKMLQSLVLATSIWSLSSSLALASSFEHRQDVAHFIQEMSSRHGFNPEALARDFAAIKSNPTVLKLIRPPSLPTQRSWQRYQSRFINQQRIEAGLRFWNEHATTLAKAEMEYGIPREIIVGIIGVETIFGRNMGSYKVMEALATLAFDYPPRAEFFKTELEQFLLLARENHQNRLSIKGSFAGAIGIPQFMPGSQRRYAVDYDGDGEIDLRNNPVDAIGSVARFLSLHGWVAKAPIAIPVTLETVQPEWLEAGIFPKLKITELTASGIQFRPIAGLPEQAALIDLITPDEPTEYWLGFENFYVITRYNRSSFYAMSVFQLAEAIREQRNSAL